MEWGREMNIIVAPCMFFPLSLVTAHSLTPRSSRECTWHLQPDHSSSPHSLQLGLWVHQATLRPWKKQEPQLYRVHTVSAGMHFCVKFRKALYLQWKQQCDILPMWKLDGSVQHKDWLTCMILDGGIIVGSCIVTVSSLWLFLWFAVAPFVTEILYVVVLLYWSLPVSHCAFCKWHGQRGTWFGAEDCGLGQETGWSESLTGCVVAPLQCGIPQTSLWFIILDWGFPPVHQRPLCVEVLIYFCHYYCVVFLSRQSTFNFF